MAEQNVLVVEERLRILREHLELLAASARVSEGFQNFGGIEFSEWTLRVSEQALVQLAAIKQALPASCTDRQAPLHRVSSCRT